LDSTRFRTAENDPQGHSRSLKTWLNTERNHNHKQQLMALPRTVSETATYWPKIVIFLYRSCI